MGLFPSYTNSKKQVYLNQTPKLFRAKNRNSKKFGGLRRESGYFTGFFGVNLAGLGSRVDSGFM